MTECPYCSRPADSQGAINHDGYCIGLKDAGLIVLQRYMLDQRILELEAALLDLYSGTAEYVYLNHLGDPHNTTPMRNAAKVLGAPALEAYDRLARLTAETPAESKQPEPLAAHHPRCHRRQYGSGPTHCDCGVDTLKTGAKHE